MRSEAGQARNFRPPGWQEHTPPPRMRQKQYPVSSIGRLFDPLSFLFGRFLESITLAIHLASSRELVHHRQYPQFPTGFRPILNKIIRPHMPRILRTARHSHADPTPLATTLLRKQQPMFTAQPTHPLEVHMPAFPPQHHAQPMRSEARMFFGQFHQTLDQLPIVPPGNIRQAAADVQQFARTGRRYLPHAAHRHQLATLG